MNKGWKLYRAAGYRVAVKFAGWTFDAYKIECALHDLTGQPGYNGTDDWHGYHGRRSVAHGRRPYFIVFKQENMLTAALLKVAQIDA